MVRDANITIAASSAAKADGFNAIENSRTTWMLFIVISSESQFSQQHVCYLHLLAQFQNPLLPSHL
jgi:hypothetical protein